MGSIRTLIASGGPGRTSLIDDTDQVLPLLRVGEEKCAEIGLGLTAKAFKRLADAMSAHEEPRALSLLVQEVQSRLSDELAAPLFLYVPGPRARYYQQPHDGWAEVILKFSKAVVDIEEASRCLAVGRNTAAVFHAMRIAERGLKALSSAMGIPYAPSWEAYLSQIAKKVAAKWQDKDVSWRNEEPFYSEAAAFLSAVKVAWRNPTMHVVRDYDEAQAEEVLVATRAFMRHLATRLSE